MISQYDLGVLLCANQFDKNCIRPEKEKDGYCSCPDLMWFDDRDDEWYRTERGELVAQVAAHAVNSPTVGVALAQLRRKP